ncbi:hypothetical protein ACWCQW_02975 [Streptomyces mirabilis]
MTITRRRKKPVEVDTIQWTGDNEAAVQAFAGGASNFYALDAEDRENSDDPEATASVFDKLHSTWILVYTGQHIVRGVKGEYYPIAEGVLAETYELAEPTPAATEVETTTRVIELYERWTKAGAPPLGTPMARWWDARLVELEAALRPAATEATEPGDIQLTRKLGRGLVVDQAPPRIRMALHVLSTAQYGAALQEPGLINIGDQVLYRVTGYDPQHAALLLELVEDWRPAPTATLTEADVEELKARWLATYGNNQGAHPVTELRPTGEEQS